MSKRYVFPSVQGEAKRAKLDITVLDHKFPLSQNKEDNQENNWGDDNEDELLLLASQACEAYNKDDISSLPDFNISLQPGYTSTPKEPSVSNNFIFKKPNQTLNAMLSTGLRDKCTKIASPLLGMSDTVSSTVNYKEDFIVNGNVCKDCDHIYKQMLDFKDNNLKLRDENGKLLEKCVTNDGEVSILRSQLKSCQVAVDNARMEKIRAQERVEMDYMQRLTTSKNEARDLRTQLDFKNLEIVSLKERCKMLESSKVKLTQVTVAGNDVSFSQRHHNNSMTASTYQSKKKVTTLAVQTCDKKNFIKLNKRYLNEPNELKDMIPLILQESTEKEISFLLQNEKLRKSQDFNLTKCRIFSTFNRIPTTPATHKNGSVMKLSLKCLHEHLCAIASNKGFSENNKLNYFAVFTQIHKILTEFLIDLENISQRITAAFQKEMDEKYLDSTTVYTHFNSVNLLSGKCLYKEEQGILPRRALAILSYVITCEKCSHSWITFNDIDPSNSSIDKSNSIELLSRFCKLFDSSSCAVVYSGFLLSILNLLEKLYKYRNTTEIYNSFKEIIKFIIISRPMPFVSCKLLGLLRRFSVKETVLDCLCLHSSGGNLKVDYDQGVMIFKKDSCILQFFLKQIEISLKAMDEDNMSHIVACTQNLLGLHGNTYYSKSNVIADNSSNRCNCSTVMIQVIVYSLYICSSYLNKISTSHDIRNELESVCRSGIHLLYQLVIKDLEFHQLGYNEGHYYIFVENCNKNKDRIILDEMQGIMLTELVGTLQPTEDCDIPPKQSKDIWIDSFNHFTIAD